jgi:hypothetical protein
MKSKFTLLLLLVGGSYFFSGSCSKGGEPPVNNDPCANVTISVAGTVTDASAGQSNGVITISSPTGSGITFSINGSAFGAASTFSSLAAGTYTITAKNASGCSGSRQFTVNVDACAGKTIVVNTSNVLNNTPCGASNDGGFTVSATGSTGFTFSVGSGAFQASGVFTGLAAGTYTVNAKDVDGCVRNGTVNVANKPAGTLFGAVRTVVQSNCAISGCHTGANPTGGLNFSNDCTIVSSWDRIKARAVDGIPSFMPPPPNPQLSNADKQKITDWIAAGHRYTD